MYILDQENDSSGSSPVRTMRMTIDCICRRRGYPGQAFPTEALLLIYFFQNLNIAVTKTLKLFSS